MTSSLLTDFARTRREVKRVAQPYGGYFRQPEVALDEQLLRVGRTTPGGEYLRRSWQPVCLSSELGELPLKVTMLGEQLVAFRSRNGEIGLPGLQLQPGFFMRRCERPLSRAAFVYYPSWSGFTRRMPDESVSETGPVAEYPQSSSGIRWSAGTRIASDFGRAPAGQ